MITTYTGSPGVTWTVHGLVWSTPHQFKLIKSSRKQPTGRQMKVPSAGGHTWKEVLLCAGLVMGSSAGARYEQAAGVCDWLL